MLFLTSSSSQLLAQCATCRAGGHCAQNFGGKCMANRTFWGYYQSNWRKWPSVAAAEQAAAYEAEQTPSPAAAAPSAVLPKPEDEAREGNTTPGTAAEAETEESTGETADSPHDNIAAPRRTKRDELPGEGGSPFDQTKPLLPTPSPVRPKLPGSDLDDPAPVLPVDPNDSVPNLPPNLRDMQPPADENLELEDLFKQPATPAPKPSGGAAQPRSNAPAEAAMTPAERTAEYTRRRREHAERNRQFMKEKYANAVKKPAARVAAAPPSTEQRAASQVTPAQATEAAAANSPSTAASLDDLPTLHRLEGTNTAIPPRTLPADKPAPAPGAEETSTADRTAEPDEEQSVAIPAEDMPDDEAPLDVDEPELLLSPMDTAAKNPLRENMEHARYAARMFTPQARSHAGNSTSPVTETRGGVNPLRTGTPSTAISQANGLREVTPVAYEEEVPAEAAETAASETETLTAIPESDVELSPAPVEEVLPMAVVPAESLLQTHAQQPALEPAVVPITVERKSSLESDSSGNMLREERAHTIERSNANPLRSNSPEPGSAGSETRGVSLPAKTPGTGRYMATLGSPTSAATQPSRPVEAESAAAPRSLGTANPLR